MFIQKRTPDFVAPIATHLRSAHAVNAALRCCSTVRVAPAGWEQPDQGNGKQAPEKIGAMCVRVTQRRELGCAPHGRVIDINQLFGHIRAFSRVARRARISAASITHSPIRQISWRKRAFANSPHGISRVRWSSGLTHSDRATRN